MSLKGTTSIIPKLFGRVKEVPAIDKTLTKQGSGADAKAVGDKLTALNTAIEKICKCDYYEDIVIKGTLYGKGYYLETHNMVIIHIVVSTTSDIVKGEVFAELSKLSKNMQTIDNVGALDMDGNGYGFRFENKRIVAQSNIAQGTRLLFDVCIRIS